jgi:hypothetical protein
LRDCLVNKEGRSPGYETGDLSMIRIVGLSVRVRSRGMSILVHCTRRSSTEDLSSIKRWVEPSSHAIASPMSNEIDDEVAE